jgi:ubiquitin-protein ligase E3 C
MTARNHYSTALLKTLCRLYGIILARWGGDGGRDCVSNGAPLVRKDVDGGKQEIASTSADQCTQSLLNNFVFSTDIVQACWGLIQSDSAVVADVYAIIDPHKGEAPVRSLSILPQYSSSSRDTMYSTSHDGSAMLFVFVSALSRILIVTDDSEIHEMDKPLPLHQLRRCIQTLKQLLYRACCLDNTFSVPENGEGAVITKYVSNHFGLALITASARTMRDLYDRSSRRPLSVPKLWLIEDLMEKEIRRCKTKEDYVRLLTTPVLRVCPFLVSFKRRLTLFERIVTSDRVSIQGENSQNPFHTNPLKPGIPIRITRGRILEDGLATMNHLGRNMRQRLAVQYYNEAGTRESGVDVGGLFKEFWTDLCAIAFDPNYALFRVTAGRCR